MHLSSNRVQEISGIDSEFIKKIEYLLGYLNAPQRINYR